jgi:putative FmdB family regulatory protein
MPIYDFKCKECGHETEKLMKHSDSNPICINTNHGSMEKQWQTPAFHFIDGAGTSMGRAWSFPGRPLWGG